MEESIQFYAEELEFEETWGFEDGSTVHRYVADENGVELQLSETEGGRNSTTVTRGITWHYG